MTRGFQSPKLGVGVRIGRADADVNELSIIPVDSGCSERLTGDWNYSLAFLAGALGDQLFDPQTKRRDLRRDRQRQFIAAGIRKRAEYRAEPSSRVVLGGNVVHACVQRSVGPIEQSLEVEALQRS